MSSRILGSAVAGIGALVAPLAIAVIGAAPASADPDVCVFDPVFGVATACVNVPGVVIGDFDGDFRHGHGNGHWRGHGH